MLRIATSVIRLVVGLALFMVLQTQSAHAALIFADPDDILGPEGTDISSAFPSVVLSMVGSGFGQSSGRVFKEDPTNGLEPFTPSTGAFVFGHDGATFPHLVREPGFLELRADFTAQVNFVSIDFISNNSADTGQLRVFDTSGVLIANLFTPSLTLNQVGTLSFAAPDIGFILASGDSGASSGGFDNLIFNTAVPEPTTLMLFGAGLLGLARRSRKSKRK